VKRHQESRPPAGAFADNPSFPTWDRPVNARLYGSREERIQGTALRARGCPTPKPTDDKAHRRAPKLKRAGKVAPAPVMPVALRVENVRRAWENATATVRRLKAEGADYSDAVTRARELRAELLKLDPDMALRPRTVELAQASDANPVKAV
jgi:hypothetical protein